MVCYLLSEWCVATSFYQRAANLVFFICATYCILFGMFKFAGGIGRFPLNTNILYALGRIVGVTLAGIVIIYFYNGKRMERGKTFSKWFFYWFYPAHLLVLGIIRVLLL